MLSFGRGLGGAEGEPGTKIGPQSSQHVSGGLLGTGDGLARSDTDVSWIGLMWANLEETMSEESIGCHHNGGDLDKGLSETCFRQL